MRTEQYLLRLGITPNYVGFSYVEYGIFLAKGEPRRLTLLTKDLYPAIADHFGVKWRAVERAIRTVIKEAWLHGNRALMEKVLHQTLLEPPDNGRFIGASVYYLKMEEEEEKRRKEQAQNRQHEKV